jgi:DNA-3-methyladenine glycosylase II
MTTTDYAKARRLLVRRDPVIAGLIKRHGPCGLANRQHEDAFKALTHAIISQQLSTKAAATIARRFDALFDGHPTASAIARLNDDQLRAVGLSSQKIRYMRDLSAKVADGSVPLDNVNELADEDVIESLTRVKGIGRWTAEMFLMFRLHRPDVLPVDDLGILKAVQRAYGLRKMPRPDRLTKIGEPWRPYRSVACWYLWASLGNKPNS